MTKIEGVTDVRVDRGENRVWVDCTPAVSVAAVVSAIESAGFSAEVVDE